MDKFWENYIKTRPADSKGAFDAFKKMNQEPRTMVAELTNMNTPDLEQSPDSFLRPGETLEDWDVTFRRPNADGGRAGYNDGQLVTPSVDGSRPGYAGRYEDTEYGSRVKYDTKLKKYVKRVARTVDGKKNYNVYIEQKPNENMKQFLERVAEKGKSQISRAKIARDKINLEQRMYTNNWTKNWLDQNLEKYGVRKFDKMLKDMSNAWQKHVPKIKIPGSDTSAWTTKVLKLPNITTSRGLESAVTKRPFTYEGFTFYTNLESSDDLISKSKSQWRKAFFKNKIRTIPNLEKKIKAYFDFINTPGVGTKKTMAFKEFADKDVLYILSNEDSGLVKASRYELFNSFKSLAKPYNDFTSKINRSETWKKNANLIEEKLGLKKNSIKNSLTAEGKKIKKLFDLKGLPDGLGYSIEHGQGISAAAKTGNVEIMKRAVNDLIGTTRRHNTQLGFHGFEANRNALIREITEGRNVKENIKSLNTLAKDVYKDFGLKGNMYSIKNGVLISKPISTALTETDRFRQYANQLAKDPEGLAFIKKRHGSLEKMLSLLDVKSGDNAATIASKIKKAPIPGKFKSLLLPIVATGGAVTGADFLKKSGILFDKEFEPTASADVPPLVAEGLSTGEKAAIAAGTFGGLGTKKGRSILGKGFRTLGTRVAALPFAGYTIYDNLKKGENIIDATLDPVVGAELMFPNLFKENVAKITSNPTLQKILKVGKYGRMFTPIGAGITAAGLGIDAYKKARDEYQKLQGMTESEKSDYLADQYEDLGGVYGEGAADGGLIGDKSGPAPTGGPMSQGLRSLYNNGRKL